MTRDSRNHRNRHQLAFALMVLGPGALLILASLVAMCGTGFWP